MKKLVIAASIAALTLSATTGATAQGPIREGLRATGEAAAQGTRAVARGTGQALQGAGQATRTVVGGAADATRRVVGGTVDATGRVIQGTADATRAVIGGTARGIATGVGALTPDLPVQARVGANLSDADRARDARWRFAQHNGEWWYYSPDNHWMYHRDGNWNRFEQDRFAANPAFSGGYAAGYRGMEGDPQIQTQGGYEGAHAASGQVYTLHHDQHGREYICDNGQRVYFDDGQQFEGEGGLDSEWGTPTPSIPTEAGVDASAGAQTSQTPDMPAPPSESGAAEGGLAPGSPRDINQNAPATEGTQGTPGVEN